LHGAAGRKSIEAIIREALFSMNPRTLLALLAAFAILAPSVPAAPAAANGAASTRNLILLGGAAAAYLIIRHNHKVHEREAAHAQRQAAREEQNDNAWAAYRQAERAYQQEAAANAELQKEIAYQHSAVESQQKELASLGVRTGTDGTPALVSYGWGNV
jgi:uncharacterized protein HemX